MAEKRYTNNPSLTSSQNRDTDQYGAAFYWRDQDNPGRLGHTVWSPFAATSRYFAPSEAPFMINYRVDHLVALVDALKNEGVTITDTIASYDYGKFVHIMDIEGNKIELWEPNDVEYERMGIQMGS